MPSRSSALTSFPTPPGLSAGNHSRYLDKSVGHSQILPPPSPNPTRGRLWLHRRESCLCVVCRGSTSISELPDLGQRQVLGGIPLSLKRTLNATKRHTPEPLPSALSPSAAPPLPLSTWASSAPPPAPVHLPVSAPSRENSAPSRENSKTTVGGRGGRLSLEGVINTTVFFLPAFLFFLA